MNIRIQDLSMTYPNGKQALSHLNLELKAPSMIGLLGPNGAGKSTLMNHLIGQKIAITSDKPQTTRNRIQTVYTDDRGQIIFLDTPGIHKAKNKLANAHFTRLCELLKCPRTLPFIPSGANSSILLKIKVTALEQSKVIYVALAQILSHNS